MNRDTFLKTPMQLFAVECTEFYDVAAVETAVMNAQCKTLDDVEAALRRAFPDCFVYRGGHHVAIHTKRMVGRFAMVRER